MAKYYFYILHSENMEKFYIGHASDISERLRKHNSNHKGFTGKVNDCRIVYSEDYATKELAYFRERQIKKWKSSIRIKALINRKGSEHPDW